MTPEGHSRARTLTMASPPHTDGLDAKLESIEQKQLFSNLAEEPVDEDEDESLLKSL